MSTFVGREAELAALRAAHTEAATVQPRTVILEGAPGVGKTSLLQAFVAELDADSVLTASGDEAEAFLRFGVLQQLLDRRNRWADPFAAGADVLEFLNESGHTPTVFVIDDAHIADADSLIALTFALRRLRADPVMALLAVRTEEFTRLPAGLQRLAEAQDGRLRLEGLTDDEVASFGASMGRDGLSRGAAARLQRHTDGNPLLLRALFEELDTEVLEASGPLPAPQSYRSLVVTAVGSLSAPSRSLVRAAAVLPEGSLLSVAAELAAVDEPEQALDELTRAHMLTCEYAEDGWRIGFAHPLARAAVHEDLGPLDRRRLHLRAAEMSAGDERLLHQLAAASGPDPELAAGLAARADELREGGDVRAAADFFLKAARASGVEKVVASWFMEAAGLFLSAGDVAAAEAAVQAAGPQVGGATRVHLEARIAWFSGQPDLAGELATRAWERVDELDRGGRGAIAAILAQLRNMEGDGLGAAVWADRALAEDLPPELADMTVAARAVGLAIAGQPEAALDSLGELPSAPDASRPEQHHQLTARGALRAALDDLTGAHRDLEALYQSSPSDLAPQRLLGMGVLAEVEYRSGKWDRSLNLAEQALSLAGDSEQLWLQGYLHAVAVLVLAARGSWTSADEHLATSRLLVEQLGDPATWAVCENVTIHLATCRAELDEVVARSQFLASVGGPIEEPGWLSWPVNYASALVHLGQLDAAEAELTRLAKVANLRGSRSRLAGLARVRGELATARRDHTEARTAFDEAMRLGEAADALEQGVIRSSYGRFLRRRGEVRKARLQLEDASRRFRALGATPFVEGVQEELAACGGSADTSAPPDMDGLT